MGLEVTPLCPYVTAYIRSHPEYLELVDDRYRGRLGG
jgi:predicted GNAT family acetyltransferase